MTNRFFPEIHGRFGFGCMRLPMIGKDVDLPQYCEMVDAFLDAGFNYFDTAHGYIGGKSELAIREGLSKRHPRESFILTDKLTANYFKTEADIRPFFESQLEACGVEYFDFYLMHAQGRDVYPKFRRCNAYETALKLKEAGKIRHFGISFHDKPEVLDRILTDYPQIEVVQIQFNYLDYEDASVESRAVYETAAKHGKPVIVMEPVKGGALATLPEEAQKCIDALGGSAASYALRFAAGFENMAMVLSGMSTLEQLRENVGFMADFKPLNAQEMEAIEDVRRVFASFTDLIPCTSCHYCVLENECPKGIRIPELFSCMNQKTIFHSWNQNFYYDIQTRERGKASDCIRCGMCEKVCPQHLPIRELLQKVAAEFEK